MMTEIIPNLPPDLRGAAIGFVGLGKMGVPMAANLCAAGFPLRVQDLDADAVARFTDAHEAEVATPETLGEADILLLMLPNGVVVRDVLLAAPPGATPLADRMRAGAVVIDMSSSAPTGTRDLGTALAGRGIAMVDAPVSGGVPRAKTGKLAIMAGGDAGLVARLAPIWSVLGSSLAHVGDLGSGHAMKALNNYVSAAGLVAACEALALARGFGIPGEKAIEVLNASTGRNNSTENKLAQFVLSERFDSGFTLGLMRKDLAAALGLGNDLLLDLPLAPSLMAIWDRAESELGPQADHTEIARLVVPKG
jgi:3-hydroxyisobutyrate dehydrogenase